MKAEIIQDREIKMIRDEKDSPIPEYDPCTQAKNRKEFNARRIDYYLWFPTAAEADKALIHINSIGDFDKASAWLDKQ